MTAHGGAAGLSGLTIGLFWWPVAFVLAIGYFVFTWRAFGGKVMELRTKN